ncbi:hypothetical protein NDU88_002209 [Pleurodeles waltl]|uniref:Uncharacterized protein n=1 Tax=Pleurodeles waltl TaxID=8319 RepID=A0AAV7R9C0_PLEWA|nr:hypothetical protein NDU88_002209 [Pleurodeles waltl]
MRRSAPTALHAAIEPGGKRLDFVFVPQSFGEQVSQDRLSNQATPESKTSMKVLRGHGENVKWYEERLSFVKVV